MQKSIALFAVTLATAAMPVVANAGTVVEFAFKKSELSTPAKREMLLDRIEEASRAYCDDGSILATKDAEKRCAASLKKQFIAAIDDEQLTLLAESEERALIRTASR